MGGTGGLDFACGFRRRGCPQGAANQMSDDDKRGDDLNPKTGIAVKSRPKTKKPDMYKVLLLNDDYTPMEFVVHVLQQFFNKNQQAATNIMLHVHRRGVGVVRGVYLRGCGNQGEPDHGLGAAKPASSSVHHRKRRKRIGRSCCHRISSRPCTAPWRWPPSAFTNTPRSSTFCLP